jgi:ferredoxin
MGRIGITYFSGTGNTWRIAQQFAQAFAERGHEVALLPMEEVIRSQDLSSLTEYDLLGIGYPIHSFNAPRLVAQFIQDLPPSQGQRVFLFVTAAGMVGGALDWARRRLTRRKYNVVHESRHYSGADYYFRPKVRGMSREEIERGFTWCQVDVQEVVGEILAGSERHIYASGAIRFFLSNLSWRFYLLGCRRCPHLLYAEKTCDQCGLCVRVCPTCNITLADGGVSFGSKCTGCLRCLSICPQEAIQCGRLLRGMGRYLASGYREVIEMLSDE